MRAVIFEAKLRGRQSRDGDHETLVARVVERIVERVLADERRKVMLEQASNFATLRLPRAQVNGIVRAVLGRKRIMIDPLRDFPLVRDGYRKGIREGKSIGKAEGMAEGKAEGKAEGMAESVLTLLAARGIAIGKVLRLRILTCTDLATLEKWLRSAATAASAAEVFAAH